MNSVVVDPANFKRVWVSADVGVYQTLDLGRDLGRASPTAFPTPWPWTCCSTSRIGCSSAARATEAHG